MFGSKKKNIADPNKDEQSAKKEAAIENKKAAKEKKKKDKVDSKIEHEKSEIAKSLGIRISNPYGYYPDDVDSIIIKLNEDLARMTKENAQLTENYNKISTEFKQLNEEKKAADAELIKLRLQAQFMDNIGREDLTFENQIVGLSKMGDINGKDYKSEVPEILNNVFNDEPEQPVNPPEESTKKIKLKLGGNK